jgi:hypothetical protein
MSPLVQDSALQGRVLDKDARQLDGKQQVQCTAWFMAPHCTVTVPGRIISYASGSTSAAGRSTTAFVAPSWIAAAYQAAPVEGFHPGSWRSGSP